MNKKQDRKELIDSEYNKFTLIEKNNLRVLKKNR